MIGHSILCSASVKIQKCEFDLYTQTHIAPFNKVDGHKPIRDHNLFSKVTRMQINNPISK